MSKSGLMMGAECANCGCKPCQACDAACDDTPSENFETVHVSVAGNENLSDGVLTASGDTNPVPTYPGGTNGPYDQTITGSATLPSGRFPCYARLQLWRNVADEEPSGSPTKELDYQHIVVRCTAGKIRFGAFELSVDESVWITSDTTLTPPSPAPTYIIESEGPIPLVNGGGDASGSPPAFLGGTFVVQAVCVDPVDGFAGVSFSAKIAWSEEAAYHVLYGRMVECYDDLPPGDPDDCLDCDGTLTPAPDAIYLTISNFDGGGAVDANNAAIDYDGTYALDLTPTALECARYVAFLPIPAVANVPPLSIALAATTASVSGGVSISGLVGNNTSGGVLVSPVLLFSFAAGDMIAMLCGGAAVSGSYSGSWILASGSGAAPSLSFDWELST